MNGQSIKMNHLKINHNLMDLKYGFLIAILDFKFILSTVCSKYNILQQIQQEDVGREVLIDYENVEKSAITLTSES